PVVPAVQVHRLVLIPAPTLLFPHRLQVGRQLRKYACPACNIRRYFDAVRIILTRDQPQVEVLFTAWSYHRSASSAPIFNKNTFGPVRSYLPGHQESDRTVLVDLTAPKQPLADRTARASTIGHN